MQLKPKSNQALPSSHQPDSVVMESKIQQTEFSEQTFKVLPKPNRQLPKKNIIRTVAIFLFRASCLFIILGFFPAIMLTNFLACKPHQPKPPEAKQYVSSMNKAQQAYVVENHRFADSMKELEIGLQTETANYETANYKYSIQVLPKMVVQSGISKHKKLKLRSYIGAVFVDKKGTPQSILCQGKELTQTELEPPLIQNGTLTCSPNTQTF